MMRYDKTLLAALLRQFATLVPDQPIALETLLPNGTDSYLENVRAASDSSSRWMFLTNYYFWKHPESQSEIQVKAFFAPFEQPGAILPLHELLDYCVRELGAYDAETPFEPLSVQQVAWVFEQINANKGSFRSLIYGHMGFDESAYSTLYVAGGMNITNAMYEEYVGETADIEAEQEATKAEVPDTTGGDYEPTGTLQP